MELKKATPARLRDHHRGPRLAWTNGGCRIGPRRTLSFLVSVMSMLSAARRLSPAVVESISSCTTQIVSFDTR